MACSSYRIANNSEKYIYYDYQRCDNSMWEYQVPIPPGQSNNFWAINGTIKYPRLYNDIITVQDLGPEPQMDVQYFPEPDPINGSPCFSFNITNPGVNIVTLQYFDCSGAKQYIDINGNTSIVLNCARTLELENSTSKLIIQDPPDFDNTCSPNDCFVLLLKPFSGLIYNVQTNKLQRAPQTLFANAIGLSETKLFAAPKVSDQPLFYYYNYIYGSYGFGIQQLRNWVIPNEIFYNFEFGGGLCAVTDKIAVGGSSTIYKFEISGTANNLLSTTDVITLPFINGKQQYCQEIVYNPYQEKYIFSHNDGTDLDKGFLSQMDKYFNIEYTLDLTPLITETTENDRVVIIFSQDGSLFIGTGSGSIYLVDASTMTLTKVQDTPSLSATFDSSPWTDSAQPYDCMVNVLVDQFQLYYDENDGLVACSGATNNCENCDTYYTRSGEGFSGKTLYTNSNLTQIAPEGFYSGKLGGIVVDEVEGFRVSSEGVIVDVSGCGLDPDCVTLLLKVNTLYKYDVNTDTTNVIQRFRNSNYLAMSPTKLWSIGIFGNPYILFEYNITLDPWTFVFSRQINLPTNIFQQPINGGTTWGGLEYKEPNKLFLGEYSIYELNISSANASAVKLFDLPIKNGRQTQSNDLYFNPYKNKLLVLYQYAATSTNPPTFNGPGWLGQFTLGGVLEYEIDLKTLGFSSEYISGIFSQNSNLYIVEGLSPNYVYKFDNLSQTFSLAGNTSGGGPVLDVAQPIECNTNTIDPWVEPEPNDCPPYLYTFEGEFFVLNTTSNLSDTQGVETPESLYDMTENKLFRYDNVNNIISEYDLTLSPWTTTFVSNYQVLGINPLDVVVSFNCYNNTSFLIVTNTSAYKVTNLNLNVELLFNLPILTGGPIKVYLDTCENRMIMFYLSEGLQIEYLGEFDESGLIRTKDVTDTIISNNTTSVEGFFSKGSKLYVVLRCFDVIYSTFTLKYGELNLLNFEAGILQPIIGGPGPQSFLNGVTQISECRCNSLNWPGVFLLNYDEFDSEIACLGYDDTCTGCTYYVSTGLTAITEGTIIYTDSDLTTPAANGYYAGKIGGNIVEDEVEGFRIISGGVVSDIVQCFTGTPTPTQTSTPTPTPTQTPTPTLTSTPNASPTTTPTQTSTPTPTPTTTLTSTPDASPTQTPTQTSTETPTTTPTQTSTTTPTNTPTPSPTPPCVTFEASAGLTINQCSNSPSRFYLSGLQTGVTFSITASTTVTWSSEQVALAGNMTDSQTDLVSVNLNITSLGPTTPTTIICTGSSTSVELYYRVTATPADLSCPPVIFEIYYLTP